MGDLCSTTWQLATDRARLLNVYPRARPTPPPHSTPFCPFSRSSLPPLRTGSIAKGRHSLGHQGPVTALCVDQHFLMTGSLDRKVGCLAYARTRLLNSLACTSHSAFVSAGITLGAHMYKRAQGNAFMVRPAPRVFLLFPSAPALRSWCGTFATTTGPLGLTCASTTPQSRASN